MARLSQDQQLFSFFWGVGHEMQGLALHFMPYIPFGVGGRENIPIL
jgi:hypothetical protein